MGFKTKEFMKEKFSPREDVVPVKDLKDWFDGPPEWKVRGLTGQELGQCNEAMDRNRNVAALLDGLVSKQDKEKAEAVRKLMGIGEHPRDVVKRIEIIVLGSVDPKCDKELALRLCRTFPIEFYLITNKINELTGKGHIPGKRKPSGEKQGSETASISATTEGGSSTK